MKRRIYPDYLAMPGTALRKRLQKKAYKSFIFNSFVVNQTFVFICRVLSV